MESVLNFIAEGNFSSRDLNQSEFLSKTKEFTLLQKLILNKTNVKSLPSEISSIRSLEYLSLNENNLFDLKIDFSLLKNLKQLICSKNLLSEKGIPESFYQCEWIIVLDFQKNAFKSIPSRLKNISELSCLNISQNKYLELKCDDLNYCRSLTHFYACGCDLKEISKIESLSKVRELHLEGNSFDGSSLDKLNLIRPLTILNLKNTNRNENNSKSILKNLKKIEELDLSFNCFSIFPDNICSLSSLKILKISNNKIKSISSLIDLLFRIEILDLSGNEIQFLPNHITSLSKLRLLFLNSNKLTSDGVPNTFDKLISLEVLNLSMNPLNYIPNSLKRCVSLKKLYVEYNNLTEFPDFSSMPNLKILYKGNQLVEKLFNEKKKLQKIELIANFDLKTNLENAGITDIEVEINKEDKKKQAFEEIQKRLIRSRKSQAKNFLQSINVMTSEEEKLATDKNNSKKKTNDDDDDYFRRFPSFEERKKFNTSNALFESLKNIDDGLVIWYIDGFSPVLLDHEFYGKFYLQESYIVLYCNSELSIKKIFVWSGSKVPIDKKISAPLIALTLKNTIEIGDTVVNETCFEESPEFLTAFNFDINRLEGTISKTSLDIIENQEITDFGSFYKIIEISDKLMACPVSSKSKMPVNPSKSCFLIVTKNDFIFWVGDKISNFFKVKLKHLVNDWNSLDYRSKSNVIFADQSLSKSKEMQFFLNEKSKIPKEEFYFDSYNNEEFSILYKVEINEKKGIAFSIIETSHGHHDRSNLLSNGVYILDTSVDIFIWEGFKSSYPSKISAIRLTEELIDIYPRPDYFQCHILHEQSENFLFTQNFAKWNFYNSNENGLKPPKSNIVTLNLSDLFMPKKNLRTESEYNETIEEMEKCLKSLQVYAFSKKKGHFVLNPENFSNIFFEQSTYFIISSLEVEKDDSIISKYICFTWKGNQSNNQGILDFNLEWKPQLILKFKESIEFQDLTQRSETGLFLSFFARKFTIAKGHWEDSFDSFKSKMFQLRSGGDFPYLRCIEIESKSENLNSNFVTILIQKNDDNNYVHCWKGTYSPQADFKDGQDIAFYLTDTFFSENDEPVIAKVFESQEPSAFWNAFDKYAPYDNFAPYEGNSRLFRISFDSIKLILDVTEEDSDFSRFTLEKDSMFLLDDSLNIFIYVDSLRASKDHMNLAEGVALLYLNYLQYGDASNPRNNYEFIYKGRETTKFKKIFHSW